VRVMGKSQRSIPQRARRCALVVVFVVGTITQQAPSAMAQGASGWVELKQGSVLELVLNTRIDSQKSAVGDRLELDLAEPVMSGNETVMPAGSRVSARITKVRRARTDNCKAGLVAWKLDAMKFPDGTVVKLVLLGDRPSRTEKPSNLGKAIHGVAMVPAYAFVLVFFLPLVIGMSGEGEPCRGRPGLADRIATGTTQYAAVAHDVRIRVKLGTN
jgi:hypothetical protein